MPASFTTITTTLGSALTTAGTLTLSYPAGYGRGDFLLGVKHELVWNGRVFRYGRDITIAFNATTIVVTMAATATIPVGSTVYLGLDCGGSFDSGFVGILSDLGAASRELAQTVMPAPLVLVSLGSPITIDRDGISVSQTPGSMPTTLATLVALTITGAQAVSGVAYLDVPRNITVYSAADSSAQLFYCVGTDCNGDAQIETIAGPNATTTQGKKAFSTVSAVGVYGTGSATAVEVGFGKILGLPFHLPSTLYVIKEMENGAAPGGGAGTVVAGVLTTPTATTGDVRGTISPTMTPNGSLALHLLVACPTASFGVPQYGDTT